VAPSGTRSCQSLPPGSPDQSSFTYSHARDDEDDPNPGGPEPTFYSGKPPLDEGVWGEPGY
jgi:hypothetical protein